MRGYFLTATFIGLLFSGSVALAQEAVSPSQGDGTKAQQAQTYPIAELGNCGSRTECKEYCDAGGHGQACLDYAAKHSLMSSEDISKARALLKEHSGPGGCDGKEACRAYCADESHVDECTEFAATHGLVAPGRNTNNENASATAKIVSVIQTSGGPGGCSSLGGCKAYCSDESHHSECAAFAQEHGLKPPKDVEERNTKNDVAQRDFNGPTSDRPTVREESRPQIDEGKAEAVLAKNGGPGGCSTREECRTYCDDMAHINECLQFAKDNGLMSQEDLDRAKLFLNRAGPGGCKGVACKAYCDDEAHTQECLDFAQKNGLMTQEDVDRAKVMMGSTGPGGCVGIACKTYCEDKSHADACMQFAVEKGFMKQEEASQRRGAQMQAGPGGCVGQACESYCEDPAHAEECRAFGKEHGITGGGDRGAGGPPPGTEMRGPGGCTSQEQCEAFCKENRELCASYDPAHNQGGPRGQSSDSGRFMPGNDQSVDSGHYGPPPGSGDAQGYYQGPPPEGAFQGMPGI